MSWVFTHHTKLVYIFSVCPFPGHKGKRGEPPKVSMGQKREVLAFSCHLLLHLCRFLRKGVSRDAKYYDEVENVITSCFACQTGSASIYHWFLQIMSVGNVLLLISMNDKMAKSVLIWCYQSARRAVPPIGSPSFPTGYHSLRTSLVSFVPTNIKTVSRSKFFPKK